jgi:hypothetical protein
LFVPLFAGVGDGGPEKIERGRIEGNEQEACHNTRLPLARHGVLARHDDPAAESSIMAAQTSATAGDRIASDDQQTAAARTGGGSGARPRGPAATGMVRRRSAIARSGVCRAQARIST